MKKIFTYGCLILLCSCAERDSSFSLLPTQDTFEQKTENINNKIDILWMVDGSGTMANHQNNLATNFAHFISGFVAKNYDYHMVVASTDAWVREYNYNAGGCTSNPNPTQSPNTTYKSSSDCQNTFAKYGDLTKFRDGDIYDYAAGAVGHRSGIYLLTSLMLPQDILNLFAINVKTGVRGDGAGESGLQSLRAVLRRNSDGSVGYAGETHTALSTFRRNEAFFAVIIISDEEDQSRKQNGSQYSSIQEYTNDFIGFMDGYTGGVDGNRRYNVNSIVLEDINNCSYGLHPQATQGDRYVSIANSTNGVVGNICSADFSNQLSEVANQIASLSTRFQLSRPPAPETIQVHVNGSTISESLVNGWTYIQDGVFHFIEFHGAAIPSQGDAITVNFDPTTIK